MTIILLHKTDLDALAAEVGSYELLRTLSALASNDGKNYAVYTDPDFAPDEDITILPFPSVGPTGSVKICDGTLTIGGNRLKVVAYRNSN